MIREGQRRAVPHRASLNCLGARELRYNFLRNGILLQTRWPQPDSLHKLAPEFLRSRETQFKPGWSGTRTALQQHCPRPQPQPTTQPSPVNHFEVRGSGPVVGSGSRLGGNGPAGQLVLLGFQAAPPSLRRMPEPQQQGLETGIIAEFYDTSCV